MVCGDFRATDAAKIRVSGELKSIITASDYAVCNFEAPVLGGGKSIEKSGPVLNQDRNSPELLKSLGFNVILLANNHIMDYGRKGCEETINCFSDRICVGAGTAEEAYKVCVVEKEGKKIGFLALVQHEFGVVESLSDKKSYGTAWINSPDVEDIIREAKEHVDYLLVFPHCGIEHIDAPLPEWRERYKRLVLCGADMIVASHPHCPQGWEVYQGKYIYYSLGNFYFDGLTHGDLWYKSLAIEIDIDETIRVRSHFLQFDTTGSIGIDRSRITRNHVERICYLLENTVMYNEYIEDACKKEFENVKYNIMRSIGGFTPHIRFAYALRLFVLMMLGKRKQKIMLNLFQNESYRWLIERHLR